MNRKALFLVLLLTAARAHAAMEFSGSNWVGFGTAPACGLSRFSICCWFNRTGTGTTASSGTGGVTVVPLIAKLVAESDGSNLDGNYLIGITSNPFLAADFENTQGGGNASLTGVSSVTSNGWHHAVFTYDGATENIYFDGLLDVTKSTNTTPRFDSIQQLAIGTTLNSSGARAGFFVGQIDDARIYNRALSSSEVASLFKSRSRLTMTTGLVGYWKLDQGKEAQTTSGSIAAIVTDSSGGSTNGTPQSTTTWRASTFINYP